MIFSLVSVKAAWSQDLVATPPGPIDYGNVMLGDSSAVTITISKSGGGSNFMVNSLVLGGTDPGEFSVPLAQDNCTGATVNPSCTFDIAFGPTSLGAKSATLTINSTAANDPVVINLSGTGIVPDDPYVDTDPDAIDFGDEGVGFTSLPVTVTISNIGNMDLNIGTLGITDSGNFNIADGSDNCSNQTVAGGADCTVGVTFSPQAEGAAVGTLDIPSDAFNAPNSVALGGNGVSDVNPVVSLTPTELNYGNVTEGTTVMLTLTITNSGLPGLDIGTLSIDGVDAASFAIVSDTCSGTTVASGASCTVEVSFTSVAGVIQAFTAALNIPSNAPTSVDIVALLANVVAAAEDGGCSLGMAASASSSLGYGFMALAMAGLAVLRIRRR